MYRPLVLFDGVMHLQSMFDNTEGKLYIAVNATGVMNPEVMTDYFRKVILPNAPQKCIVLFDGHYSHVNNAQLFKLCRDSGKDIKLICLPAGQTDKLQPLDNCAFGCMKEKWKNYKASRRLDPTFVAMSLKSGFRNTGIFPFSPETIRGTVDKRLVAQDAPVSPMLTKESSPMKDVADILRSRVGRDDDKINASIESIVSIYAGHKTATETVVAAVSKAFSFSKPKKQRKPKDQRLALDKGRNVLDSEYVEAVEERSRARLALKVSKKAKPSETADEVPKKRGRPKTAQIDLPVAVKKRTRSQSAKADLPVASKKGRSKKAKNWATGTLIRTLKGHFSDWDAMLRHLGKAQQRNITTAPDRTVELTAMAYYAYYKAETLNIKEDEYVPLEGDERIEHSSLITT
ncbi:hypothetical protein RvY_17023 [Ramazzottius varieornatus]|uniref:DDE-1 domain-containing protein n=1 Tax=Ramazzottius varieornatus TaxID=947166 RepID=A0A1D1W4R5_RAMVA|nr:hypothetical protein RvY_17023 [Ramazzottius varieornatus]